MPAFPRFASLWLLVLSQSLSCSPQGSLAVISGPINDPSNRTLRRDILAFGLTQFCAEMVKHSAPLRLNDDQPVIGRYFPQTCGSQKLDNGDLAITFSGVGYAWTNLSKKVAFDMQGQVVYDQDFLMSASTMYAYFKTRQIRSSDFKSRVIEQPIANFLNQLAPIGDNFGRQLVAAQLQKGFTVIRESDGSSEFGVGIIETGKRPAHPYQLHGSLRSTFENARSEIHQNERDFVGPVVVEDDDRAIYVTASVDGAPAVDVLVLRKADADASLGYYINYPLAGPLAGAPLLADVIQAGTQYSRKLKVPRGTYYVVLDNTPTAGQVAPAYSPLDDRAAVVSYVLQVGDAQ